MKEMNFYEALQYIAENGGKMHCSDGDTHWSMYFNAEGVLREDDDEDPKITLQDDIAHKWIIEDEPIEDVLKRVINVFPLWNTKYPKKKDVVRLVNFIQEIIKKGK